MRKPASTADHRPGRNDIVCHMPEHLLPHVGKDGALPDDLTYAKGFACSWRDERYFIHTRVTLPLTDLGKGVGFGLWVEVTPYDFFRFMDANDDDALYRNFQTEGLLANHWPGFEGTLGLHVVVRVVNVDQKPHIRQVLAKFEEMDPALFMSLNMTLDSVGELRRYLQSASIDPRKGESM